MRTTTHKKRTLVAYEVVESAENIVVNVIGVFHGGQDWEAELREGAAEPEES